MVSWRRLARRPGMTAATSRAGDGPAGEAESAGSFRVMLDRLPLTALANRRSFRFVSKPQRRTTHVRRVSVRGKWTIEIAAPPEEVYAVLSDLRRMGEFSPECRSVEWIGGATGPVPGARFVGHNRGGPVKWSRHGTVISADVGHEFSFVTEEGGREGTLWTYHLVPAGAGTSVTESYEVRWIPWWMHIVDAITFRRRQLTRNMATTLDRLKTHIESGPANRVVGLAIHQGEDAPA